MISNVQSSSVITNLNGDIAKRINVDKADMMDISEADESVYQTYIEASERFLKSLHIQIPSGSKEKNPVNEEYASIQVNGKEVASVNNFGHVQSSNTIGSKIQKLFANEGSRIGPELAEQRAEKIAQLLGGEVVKSSSAITQTAFNAIKAMPKETLTVDFLAMRDDPMYKQLQKTKEARELYLEQSAEKYTNNVEATLSSV